MTAFRGTCAQGTHPSDCDWVSGMSLTLTATVVACSSLVSKVWGLTLVSSSLVQLHGGQCVCMYN